MQHIKKPVRVSLARQVFNAMEEMIREGRWKVGDKIPSEPELAKIFSVSHNTIREAVQSLSHAGMLEARPGDGTYVMANDRFAVAMNKKLGEAQLSHILEARLALEKEIARLAAVHRTEGDLSILQEALDKCRAKSGKGIRDDMHFHSCVAEATHNPVLAELYCIVTDYVSASFEDLLKERQYDETAMQWHDDLLLAIREQDSDKAERIICQIVEFDSLSIAEL